MTEHQKEAPLLEVSNLKKYFATNTSILDILLRRERSMIQAVDDITLVLGEEDAIGIIGESGCGKTTLLMTLCGLYEPTAGEISFRGKDLASFTKQDWKEFRNSVQLIFQDPFNSLDPKLTIGEILAEPLKVHNFDRQEERIEEALEMVELGPASNYVDRFPHQLSGGEKQRVSIARAIILEPDVLLADEPVSMLDVSTQAAILNLLSDLVEELGVSLVYISHDLSTVSYVCDSINVMYLGRVVETAPTKQLLSDPRHPYTRELINAIPVPDPYFNRPRTSLEGAPASPTDLGEGCRFRDRCPDRMDICDQSPAYVEVDENWYTACHLHYDHEEFVKTSREAGQTTTGD